MPRNTREVIAARILELCKERGITPNGLANISAVPQATIKCILTAKPKTTKMECSLFARHLFTKWGWDDTYQYRTNGKLVKFDKKLMLLFDFNRPEIWQGTKLVREDG